MASSNGVEDQVLVGEKLYARILTLNRAKQLNALSFEMVSKLLEVFLAYEDDPNVKLVILKGKGRAFCAGGDVAAVVLQSNAGNWKLAANFFWREYTLNYVMATYSKPQVSILNGIVMGGGAGVSFHGRFRIATENTVFAMPEAALGLTPDVGASYFLSRLPGFLGEYIGLTGTRLDGAEMLACGLATHFVSSVRLPGLEESLSNVKSGDLAIISAIIDQYVEQPCVKKQSPFHRLNAVDRCFSRKTIEEILWALEQEAVGKVDDWISATLQALKKASPMSLKVSLKSIREGRLSGIGQCLSREYRVVSHALRGDVCKDFMEGCRAILLDKDMNPKWVPPTLELASNSMVDRYFSKVDEEGWEDLKLPARPNVPAHALAKL